LIAWLLPSVPPELKIISLRLAPQAFAILSLDASKSAVVEAWSKKIDKAKF